MPLAGGLGLPGRGVLRPPTWSRIRQTFPSTPLWTGHRMMEQLLLLRSSSGSMISFAKACRGRIGPPSPVLSLPWSLRRWCSSVRSLVVLRRFPWRGEWQIAPRRKLPYFPHAKALSCPAIRHLPGVIGRAESSVRPFCRPCQS